MGGYNDLSKGGFTDLSVGGFTDLSMGGITDLSMTSTRLLGQNTGITKQHCSARASFRNHL